MSTTKEITRNLGGNRLGSGNKNDIDLHAYNRSTHDLTRVWRSSMNVGTLVPFLVEVGTNGDSFSINLDNITRTLPSLGPLYGSYKLQLDVFEAPLRLYNGLLHNNMNGIGLKMNTVKFPKIRLSAKVRNRNIYNEDLNKSQISKSSLINYLGINGIGDADFSYSRETESRIITRKFNAVPLLAYWDIYKNYYANKQEEKGAVIEPMVRNMTNRPEEITYGNDINGYKTLKLRTQEMEGIPEGKIGLIPVDEQELQPEINFGFIAKITLSKWAAPTNFREIQIAVMDIGTMEAELITPNPNSIRTLENGDVEISFLQSGSIPDAGMKNLLGFYINKETVTKFIKTSIETFDLSEIDNMRMEILRNTGQNSELVVNEALPGDLWSLMCRTFNDGTSIFVYPQTGLGLKTYQSDLFNNWLKTEWIDGADGINKITAIDTSSGSFEIDALILSKKIYNMLNRIAVSGGSYEDWQEAVYSVKAIRRAETPVYRGGMSAEIMFSEVISNAATTDEPLGTLAGKGGEHGKKGGQIEISCDEPCFIMGIVSITPRVDYSQGNKWFMTELDTMDDLHKPALDGIGFEDLLQERMAYWGTIFNESGEIVKMAAGKVPAWMNYMTAVNETHGDFAEEDKCMYMTLNRRYEYHTNLEAVGNTWGIKDLTTYVDPRKYNYIFADSSIDSQNFWIQIGIGINARRVMSAKIIPYL